MEPLKPRRQDLVKVDWKISRECKGLISEYSKYSNYQEEEIIEIFIQEINKDAAFLDWVNNKRFTKRAKRYIVQEPTPESLGNLLNGNTPITQQRDNEPSQAKSNSSRKKKAVEKMALDDPEGFILENEMD